MTYVVSTTEIIKLVTTAQKISTTKWDQSNCTYANWKESHFCTNHINVIKKTSFNKNVSSFGLWIRQNFVFDFSVYLFLLNLGEEGFLTTKESKSTYFAKINTEYWQEFYSMGVCKQFWQQKRIQWGNYNLHNWKKQHNSHST